MPAGALDIVFDDVSVAFEGGARSAIQGVSLRIAPGDHIALTGMSGAGKSTLLSLLLGFRRRHGWLTDTQLQSRPGKRAGINNTEKGFHSHLPIHRIASPNGPHRPDMAVLITRSSSLTRCQLRQRRASRCPC
jgi:energy-coupling factor transporter ATP-binding protein EcfA2